MKDHSHWNPTISMEMNSWRKLVLRVKYAQNTYNLLDTTDKNPFAALNAVLWKRRYIFLVF